jgi:hypothetical protein
MRTPHSQMVCVGVIAHDYEAEIISSLLESHSISFIIQGRNHRRMLGMLGAYIEMRILVERDDEGPARAILEQYTQNLERSEEEGQEESEEMTDDAPASKLVFNRLGQRVGVSLLLSAFLGFGMASIYAGAWPIGLLLGIAQGLTYVPDLVTSISSTLDCRSDALVDAARTWLPLIDLICAMITLTLRPQPTKSARHFSRFGQ